jgi:2-methylcitrate dehydratase
MPASQGAKFRTAGDATSRAVRLTLFTMKGEMGVTGVLTAYEIRLPRL